MNWAAFNLLLSGAFAMGLIDRIPADANSPDAGIHASGEPSRRRIQRLGVQTGAAVRNVYGVAASGTVVDVSEHGCQVELRSGYLREGQFVSIRIGGLEPWVGVVRWGDHKSYGIEFAHPLYGPIVEHLAEKHPVVTIE